MLQAATDVDATVVKDTIAARRIIGLGCTRQASLLQLQVGPSSCNWVRHAVINCVVRARQMHTTNEHVILAQL
jgi:hypothetical protein